jgi:hypothetical protein
MLAKYQHKKESAIADLLLYCNCPLNVGRVTYTSRSQMKSPTIAGWLLECNFPSDVRHNHLKFAQPNKMGTGCEIRKEEKSTTAGWPL